MQGGINNIYFQNQAGVNNQPINQKVRQNSTFEMQQRGSDVNKIQIYNTP